MRGKLDNAQKAAIYQAWKDGAAVTDLSKKYGVSKSAISQLITNLNKASADIGLAVEPQKKTQINEEFDVAVDAMIAESKAADAEEPAAIAEPEKLPGVVLRALTGHLNDLKAEIEAREERIAELKIEIEEFRKDIEALKAWKETHT